MNQKITIIAELAQGFEGSFEQARLLIKAAAAAGADAAKFQLVYADELATPDYQYYDLFRKLEMKDTEWQNLASYANESGIKLYLDIFGMQSLKLSEKIGIECIKLHGTDISNIGLLKAVADSSIKKIMLGAGGAVHSEIDTALSILNKKEVILLLGFQSYPTPDESNQINRVSLLKEYYKKKYSNLSLGFADHADPASPLRYALAAVAIGAGAVVIEKHLTLGQVMKLEDHESALNPDEFMEFANVIRNCDKAIGDTVLTEDFGMSESEKKYRSMIRRHAVSGHDLMKGTVIAPEDIVLKRTSADAVITDLNLVYQKVLNKNIKGNSAILLTDIN